MDYYLAKLLGLFLLFLIFTSFLGFLSAVRPPRLKSTVTPLDFGLAFEKIVLNTVDGKKLSAWFIANNNSQKVLILMHGYPANKGDILPLLAFLADHYNILLFDFRGLGESDGLISTVGFKEMLDLKAAVSFLASRGFEKIALWGFSLGGAVALMTAEELSQVKAVIADSSYAELYLLAPALYHFPFLNKPLGLLTVIWAKLILGIDVRKVSPRQAALKIKKPVLIIHSRNDEVVPFGHALLLKKALKGNNKAVFWETLGPHGLIGSSYQAKILEFLGKSF